MIDVLIFNATHDVDAVLDFSDIVILDRRDEVPSAHFTLGVVVTQGEIVLAKAALYYNPDIAYRDKNVALVGAYASIDHDEAVGLLFMELEKQAREKNIDFLIGPMNGSTWERYRFHDMADQSIFFSEMTHPMYYPQQWAKHGFQSIAKYYSSETYSLEVDDPAVSAYEKRLYAMGVAIRSIQLDRYAEELVQLHPFLLTAFAGNFLYTPLDKERFIEKYLPLQPYLDPSYVLIASHQDHIAGVFLCVEDVLNPNVRTLVIKTIARNPDPIYRGLGHVMAKRVYQSARSNGVQRLVHAFLKEEGTSTPISRHFHGVPFKSYTLYGKSI